MAKGCSYLNYSKAVFHHILIGVGPNSTRILIDKVRQGEIFVEATPLMSNIEEVVRSSIAWLVDKVIAVIPN